MIEGIRNFLLLPRPSRGRRWRAAPDEGGSPRDALCRRDRGGGGSPHPSASPPPSPRKNGAKEKRWQTKYRAPLVTALLGASLLAGCISVLPKEKDAQLYRFGGPSLTAQAAPAAQARFPVQMVPLSFDRAAAGDRILTMTGAEAAYIKGSRWVASANSLFEAAVANAFDADGGAARLLARGEPIHPDYTLKLDVRAFETRYEHGHGAPPTVVIELYAALGQVEGRAPAGERIFRAQVPAAEDRVGAITAAYDQALGKVLGALVAWVDAKGAG